MQDQRFGIAIDARLHLGQAAGRQLRKRCQHHEILTRITT